MNTFTRWLRHLTTTRMHVRRHFPSASLEAITIAVAASETRHMGELRFAVEAALDLAQLRAGLSARERAIEVFSELRVWDTERNSGVLIYMLLADRRVEIVADRGIDALVGAEAWQQICAHMESAFGEGRFTDGVLEGIAEVSRLLEHHYPAQRSNPNELPDQPTLL